MKKYLSVFLILLLVLGVANYCFATEVENNGSESIDEVEFDEGEEIEGTDEGEEIELNQEESETTQELPIVTAKVIEVGTIQEINTQEDENFIQYYYYYGIQKMKLQTVKVEVVQKGEYEGKTYEMEEVVEVDGKNVSNFKVGQIIYVQLYESETEISAYKAADKKNTTIIYIMIVLAILLIGLSRIPGLKTLALIILNSFLVIYGAFNLYIGIMPMFLILSIVGILMIVSNVLILNKINKQSFLIMGSVILSTVLVCGILIGISNILSLTGMTEYSYNYQVPENGTEFIELINYAMIIASIGIAIDIAIKTSNATKEDRNILNVFKKVGENSMNAINMTFIIWLGMFVPIFISILSNIRGTDNSFPILNYDAIVYEIVRVAIILSNVILIVPITTILSREILYKNKTISDGKTETDQESK